MSTRALGEAITRGLNSAAAVLAGPVADPETWGYRRIAAIHGNRIDLDWLRDQVDVRHPEWVLGTWELEARLHLGQLLSPGTNKPTLTEARDYLNLHLTRLAHAEDFAFDELAADLRSCRAFLEVVLSDGEAIDRGADCPTCGCTLAKDYGTEEDDDRWVCARGHWWTDHDYRVRIATIYVGVADVLPLTDLATRVRVPLGTLKRWASGERRKRADGTIVERPAKITACRLDAAGRRLFRVDHVIQVRDQMATRQVG